MTSSGGGPLAGIRVLDFTANMAGPFATQILADQGADVIKVEPPDGDVSRRIGDGVENYSAFFANLNRGKRSIAVDLDHSDGDLELIRALVDRADIVIHSYRPTAAHRFGLDADQVRGTRPRIIHATITGFGATGPYGGRPAYDHVIQAAAGFATAQADPATGEPELIRQGFVDKLVGHTAAQALTAALFQRTRTGTGTTIEIRMLEAAIAFLWPDTMMNHTIAAPTIRRPSISRSFRLTRTADGYLAFILVTPAQFSRLATAIDATASPDDQRAMLKQTASRLAQLSTTEGVELLARFDIPVAPVMTLESLHEHPQTRHLATIDEFDHPILGTVRQPRPAIRFSGHAQTPPTAPQLDEHRADILNELVRAGATIDDMNPAVEELRDEDASATGTREAVHQRTRHTTERGS